MVVKENEHGFVIKTFGDIKALLTHADIKANVKSGKRDYKIGSIAKGYVLFKKKDKGMALTLDKAKAKELKKENENKNTHKKKNEEEEEIMNFEDFLPSASNIEEMKDKYKSLIKPSTDPNNIGKVF